MAILDRFCTTVGLLAFLEAILLTGCAFGQTTIPSEATEQALRKLSKSAPQGKNEAITTRDYKVDPANLPDPARSRVQSDAQGNSVLPLAVSNTMLIQFVPNASPFGIDNFIKERNLTVVDTFPSLGAIRVRTDLNKYFAPSINDKDQNQALLRGFSAAIADFTKDPIVRSAAPDVLLNKQSDTSTLTNILKPSEVTSLAGASAGGVADWGIGNVEADKLWDLPGARDGALIGILDVGFGKHQDLVFIDLPQVPVEDHGTHVAGIACARGSRVRGVLPNCFIRARTGDVFFESVEGGDVTRFVAIFSQILSTLDKFVSEHNDLRVINVSMGYNWKPNFNINPDDPESSLWRVLVEQQGLMLMTALERADRNNQVIYSAAGNDSAGLSSPIQARYASAINWAALTAREKGLSANGVVVEAHDSKNKRARFSNTGGNLSCPGVDVISTVAHDQNGAVSETMYGKMSGTSMASPYCAAAHVLFSLVRPGYTGREIATCLMSSTQKSDSGVPLLKLSAALEKCPDRKH